MAPQKYPRRPNMNTKTDNTAPTAAAGETTATTEAAAGAEIGKTTGSID